MNANAHWLCIATSSARSTCGGGEGSGGGGDAARSCASLACLRASVALRLVERLRSGLRDGRSGGGRGSDAQPSVSPVHSGGGGEYARDLHGSRGYGLDLKP
jgi:hypothetical protein